MWRTVCCCYTTFLWSSWEHWWKTKETAASQDAFSTWSLRPFLSEQWFHWDRSQVQSESSAGGFTCLPFTQRRQRNLRATQEAGAKNQSYRIHLTWTLESHITTVLGPDHLIYYGGGGSQHWGGPVYVSPWDCAGGADKWVKQHTDGALCISCHISPLWTLLCFWMYRCLEVSVDHSKLDCRIFRALTAAQF